MAKASVTQTAAPAEPEAEAVAPETAPAEASAEEVVAEPETPEEAAPAEPEAEAVAGEAPDGFILMHHPDGGACDAFLLDDAGNAVVPIDAIDTLLAHGFVSGAREG